MRPVENLSRRQRAATPEAFGRHLVASVRALCRCQTVAVLWVADDTVYRGLGPDLDLWDRERNARLYAGPHPVLCHPPCGPWGKYHHRCRQDPADGILAMEMVHRWGGIVEQPLGSRLFREHGRGGRVVELDQADYGHPSQKRTRLYIVPPDLARRG